MINHCIETLKHKWWVLWGILKFCARLIYRALIHDFSKFRKPEASLFAEVTPELEDTTYGSDKYRELLHKIRPALDHHYRNNSHHPEYYPNGVHGMDLLDVVEMYYDWKAATRRHSDGDILTSIEKNRERFDLDDQVFDILWNTADE